jgi:hypothetical protein
MNSLPFAGDAIPLSRRYEKSDSQSTARCDGLLPKTTKGKPLSARPSFHDPDVDAELLRSFFTLLSLILRLALRTKFACPILRGQESAAETRGSGCFAIGK